MQNPLACINTALLQSYSTIHTNIRILAAIIKRWAKCRDINDPSRVSIPLFLKSNLCERVFYNLDSFLYNILHFKAHFEQLWVHNHAITLSDNSPGEQRRRIIDDFWKHK